LQIISFVDELTLIAEGCGEIKSGKVKKTKLNGIKTKKRKEQKRTTKNTKLLMLWIRIRKEEHENLLKLTKKTWFSAFQKGFCVVCYLF
jgi:hypothetical protein